MKLIHLFTLFILLFFGCKKEQSKTWDESQVINDIETMFNAYHEAVKQNGLSAEFD